MVGMLSFLVTQNWLGVRVALRVLFSVSFYSPLKGVSSMTDC